MKRSWSQAELASMGVKVGPESPLHQVTRSRRRPDHIESEMQREFVGVLLGPIGKLGRVPGAGMTTRFPELSLLYAIPNAGQRSRALGGIMKAEGMLADSPDLCLPVARGGYHAFYLEFKAPGKRLRPGQEAMIVQLQAQGNMALWADDVGAAITATVAYLQGNLQTLAYHLQRWPALPRPTRNP